jgi:CheY-like chemotaxis protein
MKLPDWLQKSRDAIVILLTISVMSVIGFGIVLSQNIGTKPSAFLWSLACTACGIVIGFLFGIPRVLQQESVPVATEPNNKTEARQGVSSQSSYRLQVNTNLEQISDWLTKIIVGLGLIELRNFPQYMSRASGFIGGGLGSGPDTRVFAGAMILYFAVLGFLGGYLLTRLYLTGAFKRADIEAVVVVAGTELTIQEVSEQVRISIGDLQTQIVEMQRKMKEAEPRGSFDLAAATSVYQETPKVHSVLWVDDFPRNNSLIIEYLNKLGIEVVTAATTAEGLAKLRSKKFDRVISDMGRVEKGINVPAAGINLVREVQKAYPEIPVVIYCSVKAANQYRTEALAAGATQITPSQTELLEALKLHERLVA